jgi:hypothetical protein
MKNITLSAEERLIEAGRAEARARKTTLNEMFRTWLADIAAQDARSRQSQVQALFGRLTPQVDAGRKFTREEMNER